MVAKRRRGRPPGSAARHIGGATRSLQVNGSCAWGPLRSLSNAWENHVAYAKTVPAFRQATVFIDEARDISFNFSPKRIQGPPRPRTMLEERPRLLYDVINQFANLPRHAHRLRPAPATKTPIRSGSPHFGSPPHCLLFRNQAFAPDAFPWNRLHPVRSKPIFDDDPLAPPSCVACDFAPANRQVSVSSDFLAIPGLSHDTYIQTRHIRDVIGHRP